MHVIFRLNGTSGSGDVEYLAFTGVKLHVPGSFPTLQTLPESLGHTGVCYCHLHWIQSGKQRWLCIFWCVLLIVMKLSSSYKFHSDRNIIHVFDNWHSYYWLMFPWIDFISTFLHFQGVIVSVRVSYWIYVFFKPKSKVFIYGPPADKRDLTTKFKNLKVMHILKILYMYSHSWKFQWPIIKDKGTSTF